MLNLLQLRVFVEVAQTGGIRSAAARVGRTPSAVSMALKQLEGQLGAALFEGERKDKLTRFGAFVFDHARNLLEHGERVARAVGTFSADDSGSVDAALLPSVAVAFLPEAMRRMMARSPTIAMNIRDLDSRAVHEAVRREVVEVGIAGQAPASSVRQRLLFSEPLTLVCREDDPLCATGRPVEWDQVAGRHLVWNNSFDASLVPEIPLSRRLNVRSVISLLAVVRAGVGVTILPALSRLQASEGLSYLPLADPRARRFVYLLTHADRAISDAGRFFIETILDVIRCHGPGHGLTLPAEGEDPAQVLDSQARAQTRAAAG
jgi:DNA-binding transcriptional LysR family regulator